MLLVLWQNVRILSARKRKAACRFEIQKLHNSQFQILILQNTDWSHQTYYCDEDLVTEEKKSIRCA